VVSDRKLGQLNTTYELAPSGAYIFNNQASEYIFVASGGTHNIDASPVTEDNIYDVYLPEVMSYSDYYPFHMQMPNRHSGSYRYLGANGQESETEITGDNSHSSAEYWMYDNRLGRRWNLDPVVNHWESRYASFNNNPIKLVDLLGNAPYDPSNAFKHYTFFTKVAIGIFDAAKAKGVSDAFALLVVAQAGFESGYSDAAVKYNDYNLFSVKGATKSTSKRPEASDGGYFKAYTSYDEALEAYFENLFSSHYQISEIVGNSSFNSDDLDKAFNTGEYFPDKATRSKTGKGSYGGNSKESVKNYGTTLFATFQTTKKLFIEALDYKIQTLVNEQVKILAEKQTSLVKMQSNPISMWKEVLDQTAKYNELQAQINELNSYKNEIENIDTKSRKKDEK